MSRPKPTIIMDHTDKKYKSDQILEAHGIYAVFLNGKPINLKSYENILSDKPPRYKKVSFSNAGHAFNLAERLNKLFKTDKFEVYLLTAGTLVKE